MDAGHQVHTRQLGQARQRVDDVIKRLHDVDAIRRAQRIHHIKRLPLRHIVGRLGLALALAVPALILWVLISSAPFTLQALVVLPLYAGSYLGWAWWRRFPELRLWHSRLGR